MGPPGAEPKGAEPKGAEPKGAEPAGAWPNLAAVAGPKRATAAGPKRATAAGPNLAAAGSLVRANLHYWPTVAPSVRAHLRRWQRRAGSMPDPSLRGTALAKLRDERFNVEVAATLGTLAPGRRRAGALSAIVALQIAYDYLDLLTESPRIAGRPEARRLLGALVDAVDEDGAGARGGDGDDGPSPRDGAGLDPRDGGGPSPRDRGGPSPRADPGARTLPDDGEYLARLVCQVRESLARLPGAARARPVAKRSAARCADAQALCHGARDARGERELRRWASGGSERGPLGWREHAAGASAAVLCLHALIAAAADPRRSRAEAATLDRLYLAIGALTMLDGLVDRRADAAEATRSWPARYRDEHEMASSLAASAARARHLALRAPDSGHHLVTLAGVVAYYVSAAPAADGLGGPLNAALRAELGGTLGGPLLVMRMWRLAKRGRRIRRPWGVLENVFGLQARRWRWD